MKYADIEELNAHFINGEFASPDSFIVSDVPYKKHARSSIHRLSEFIDGGSGFQIYRVDHLSGKNILADKNLREWIAFAFEFGHGKLSPAHAFTTSPERHKFKLSLKESKEVIGDYVNISFVNMAGSSLKGRVDTGATVSSLHCDEFNIDKEKNRVSFTCSHLSQNTITVPLDSVQSVSSADGGVENRPVICMDIQIGEQTLEKVKFNLNNRSHMEYPVLVGQNILDKGDYLIDPKMKMDEDIDWESLTKMVQDMESGDTIEPEHDDVAMSAESPMVDEVDPDHDVGHPHPYDELPDAEDEHGDSEEDSIAEREAEIDRLFQSIRGSTITFGEILEYGRTYEQDEPD